MHTLSRIEHDIVKPQFTDKQRSFYCFGALIVGVAPGPLAKEQDTTFTATSCRTWRMAKPQSSIFGELHLDWFVFLPPLYSNILFILFLINVKGEDHIENSTTMDIDWQTYSYEVAGNCYKENNPTMEIIPLHRCFLSGKTETPRDFIFIVPPILGLQRTYLFHAPSIVTKCKIVPKFLWDGT